MAILVTGGAGFVGVNVVQALSERGDEVVCFDAGELPAGAEAAFAGAGRVSIERGSVLEPAAVEALFRKHRIERVIHSAAITSGPQREARDPASIVDVNLRGTINVLDAARKANVRRAHSAASTGAANAATRTRTQRFIFIAA